MIYHNSALLTCKKTEYTKQQKVKQKKKEGIPPPVTAVCCWEVDGNAALLPVPVLLLLLLSLLSLSVEDDDTEPDLFCRLAACWNGFSCNMNI
jgi:hypothetical protein